ncbi:hypothetical protein ACH5RR_002552 [Cinchona calisaya]|uniref:YTH domain-containing family protein n=1 Tax=Cinchona calisaya TaxID=153742 RepID=A0ABD3ASC0_9GENT
MSKHYKSFIGNGVVGVRIKGIVFLLTIIANTKAAKLLQKLSLDTLDKPLQDPPEPTKKYTLVDIATQNGFKPFERTATSPHLDLDPSMFYNPVGYPSSTCYYGGFNGSSDNDWDWYGSSNGVEMHPGIYGDYQNSYGHTPNGTYSSSSSAMGPDNSLYGPIISRTVKRNQNSIGSGVSNRDNVSKPLRPNYQTPYMKSSDFYGWGGLPSQVQVILQPFHMAIIFLLAEIRIRVLSHISCKYRSRGHGSNLLAYSSESMDGLELNKGPRAKGFKDQKDSEAITLAVKGQSILVKGKSDEDNLPVFPDGEQYNKDDFSKTDSDAKFFVNASGQFVGLAEMVGPVDFDKSVEYWQQDKWTGCFSIKWHIIKDIPNSILRHITLENNENKPVTNNRDTQEVRFEQATEIIKIFKDHSSRTCILDDFEFYEGHQRTMQEKKAQHKQFYKQASSALTEDSTAPKATIPRVIEVTPDLKFFAR